MSHFIHLLLLTGLTLLVLQWKIFSNRKRFIKYAVFFIVSFCVKLLLVYFNEEVSILGAKPAGDSAANIHQIYQQVGFGAAVANSENFILQWLVNFSFFELSGPNRVTLLINNVFIGLIIPLFTAYGVKRCYGTKYENYTLILFAFFPSFLNFSIFGLRDIIILSIVCLNAVAVISLYHSESRSLSFYKSLLIYFLSCLLILFIRPEMIVILGFPAVIYLFRRLLNIVAQMHNQFAKVLIGALFITLFAGGIFVLANYTTVYLASHIGFTSDVSAIQIIEQGAGQRYERQFRGSGGAGSAIVDRTSYHQLGTGGRWAVQTVGMIVIPFPWQVTSVTKLLAFIETLAVLLLLYYLFQFYYRQLKKNTMGLVRFLSDPLNILGITFLFSVALYGFMVINFGNAFRLRMSILPYLILPATYLLVQKIN